jgi:phosphoglycerol transferase
MADNLHFLVLKALSWFRGNPALVYNLYYLLTFPLVTLAALAVFRHFSVAEGPALVGSLLYTFLPYHFLRGMVGHLFLASYFLVPLLVMAALWICTDQQLTRRFSLRNGKLLVGALICILVSSAGVYYAFFACFLLLVAGLLSTSYARSLRPLGTSLFFVSLVFAGILANVAPSLLYRHEHGPNTEAVLRLLAGPEIYGLKITQLLLPTSMHRLTFLAEKKIDYIKALPDGNGDYWYLGVLGSIGFLTLIGRLLYHESKPTEPGLLEVLSVFNVFAILLATVAGFGSFLSVMAGSWIRAYERMSIYIAFFACFTVVLLLDRAYRRFLILQRSRIVYGGLLGILLTFGLWDQTSRAFIPMYTHLKNEYASDGEFVRQIEASVPAGGMVFQLPYVPFPEFPPVVQMGDYDLLRGYLHSKSLRWSYAAMKGRQSDAWLREVAARPLEALLPELSRSGFQGIYLDRFGFLDGGVEMERQLSYLLDTEPLVSRNKRLVFFNMAKFNQGTVRHLALGK